MHQYGIKWDGPITEGSDMDVYIGIPATVNPLHLQEYQGLTRAIDPLRNSDSYGIDIFVETLAYVRATVTQ